MKNVGIEIRFLQSEVENSSIRYARRSRGSGRVTAKITRRISASAKVTVNK